VPSLLRDFSAPVVLQYDYSDAELAFLLAHDSDPSTAGKPASAWPCAAC
jgi:aminopeptidase N